MGLGALALLWAFLWVLYALVFIVTIKNQMIVFTFAGGLILVVILPALITVTTYTGIGYNDFNEFFTLLGIHLGIHFVIWAVVSLVFSGLVTRGEGTGSRVGSGHWGERDPHNNR